MKRFFKCFECVAVKKSVTTGTVWGHLIYGKASEVLPTVTFVPLVQMSTH